MGRLVLVGAGHGHLDTLARLRLFQQRGHQVTIISPSSFHYYSGLGPSLLSGRIAPERTRFHMDRITQSAGCRFILDSATGIDTSKQRVILASGHEIAYDVVSFNIGSSIQAFPQEHAQVPLFPVKPIENLHTAHLRLQELAAAPRPNIVVIGGGPAGVEISGAVWELLQKHYHATPDITLVAGKQLLKTFPERTRSLVSASLTGRGIDIVEGRRAVKIQGESVLLDNGSLLKADLVLLATGIRSPKLFSQSHLQVGKDGGLAVNQYLQSVNIPNVFGSGDCIHFQDQELDKVGVYAVTQSPILADNLLGALEGTRLKAYKPQQHYMLIINLGDGTGIFVRNGVSLQGRCWLWLKDWIDLKLMKKFIVH